jgi:hypothetical protein
MPFDRRRYAIRLLLSMSRSEAIGVLGFPPGYEPTPQDIQKAYRARALANHPDRGGDPAKMVELNVAKDILTGQRSEDRTPVGPPAGPNPEEKRRAKREMDIRMIEEELRKVRVAFDEALLYGQQIAVGPSWRADLKEFLIDEFAAAIDTIHDQAEAGLATAASKKGLWQKALSLTQDISGGALRLTSKMQSLKKQLAFLKGEPSFSKTEAFFKDAQKFVKTMNELQKRSSELRALIATTDHLPLDWMDLVLDVVPRISAYQDDTQKAFDLATEFMTSRNGLEGVVERAVDAVTQRLERDYDVKGLADWKDWRPSDFTDAIKTVKKSTPNKTAQRTAQRIVERFRTRV